MNRQQWRRGVTKTSRGKAKRKPDEEVTQQYRTRRHLAEKREEYIRTLGKAAGLAKAKTYGVKYRRDLANKDATAATTPGADVRPGLQRAALQHEPSQAAKYPKKKTPASKMRKILRQRAQAVSVTGQCTALVGDGSLCEERATSTAMGCKLNEGRCERHKRLRCSGGVATRCKCATETSGAARLRGPSRASRQQSATHRRDELRLGETAVIRIDTAEGWKTATVLTKRIDKCRRGERKPQYVFKVTTGDATIRVGHDGTPRLRDVDWWLVRQRAREESSDDTDPDSATEDDHGDQDDRDADESGGQGVDDFHEGQAPGTYTCAAHAINNAMGAVRITPADFDREGYGETGPWADFQIQKVAAASQIRAITAPTSFSKSVEPDRVAEARWIGVLLLDGAANAPIGHWTTIRRCNRGGYAHINSLGITTPMTAAEAAVRIRHTGMADGHVMVIWTDPETDSRSFFRQPKRPPPEPETPKPPRGKPRLARSLRSPTAATDAIDRKRAAAPENETRRGVADTVATRTRGKKRRTTQRDDGDNGCWVTIPAWSPDAMDFDWSNTFQHGPTAAASLAAVTTDDGTEPSTAQAPAAEHTEDGAAAGAPRPTQQSGKRGRRTEGMQDRDGRSPKRRAPPATRVGETEGELSLIHI